MNKLMIAFVAAASLFTVGCKKKNKGGEALAKMEGFAKSMCDCKDKACADKVTEEMTKWTTEMSKGGGDKDAKPDPELAKKMGDVTAKLTECTTKIMMAGAGGGSAEPVKKDEPAAGSAEPKKDEPAAGSAEPAKDEPKKDEPKKDEPKKDEPAMKKDEPKKEGGW